MPTNVSTPIWACDLCGAKHGERLDLAERCESVPLPEVLPAGTPILTAWAGRFELARLAATGRIETDIRWGRTTPGHHREYQYQGPRDRIDVSGRDLLPGLPGFLQTFLDSDGTASGGGRPRIDGAAGRRLERTKLYRAFGLGADGARIRSVRPDWRPSSSTDYRYTAGTQAQPITPEVRRVFELLAVGLDSPRAYYGQRHALVERGRIDMLLAATRGCSPRAKGMLDTLSPDALDAEVEDLQRRWFAGEQVVAPEPRLVAGVTMTASRLSKDAKAAVAATGVKWPARTSASEYARLLLKETLMETQHARQRAFGTARIVAVGGGKGGVGKSTTAAALAVALAGAGRRVLLLDFDFESPSLRVMFGLPATVPISEDMSAIVPHEVLPGLRVFSHDGVAPRLLPARWSDAVVEDWVRFLGETIDASQADVVVLDLPAGRGAAEEQVFGFNSVAQADVFVAVGSADPLTMPALERSLEMQMHERRARIVVENLGRVVGVDASGMTVEVRPHGPVEVVEALAARQHAVFGGSLPYARGWRELADSDEMQALARMVSSPTAGATDT